MILDNISNAFKAAKIAYNVLKSNTLYVNGRMTEAQYNSFSDYSLNTSTLLQGSGVTFQTNAYNNCPPLQAIINKKCQSLAKCNIIAVDDNGIEIKSAGFNDDIKIINNPNEYQTKNQFLRTIETFINVYGSAFIYKVKPIGLDKITGLIVIPNNCISINYNTGTDILSNNAKLIRSLSISIYGKTFILYGDDLELIYEIQDVSVNLTNGSEFRAKSRVDSMRKPIENIVGSLESRNHLIIKRGADVILSPVASKDATGANIMLNPLEQKEMDDLYQKTYGLLNGQTHTLFAKLPLQVNKIGLDVKQLGLFDGENIDHKTLALGFGVPPPLLSLPDTSHYNTLLEAKTELYEDTIIPEADIIMEAFSIIFNSKEKGYNFKADFSHLGIFQKANKQNAESINVIVGAVTNAITAGLMTSEEGKEIINQYTK